MALIQCHECKSEVSTEAKVCPKCGAKVRKTMSKRTKFFLWAMGITVVLAGALAPKSEDACNDPVFTEGSAFGTAKRAIEAQLKAPSSADFASLGSSQVLRQKDAPAGECIFLVQSYVDAQNSFGAKIRTNYEVKVRGTADNKWSVLSTKIAGK